MHIFFSQYIILILAQAREINITFMKREKVDIKHVQRESRRHSTQDSCEWHGKRHQIKNKI